MNSRVTVAQGLADILYGLGVQFIFGTAGDTILHFLASLGKHPLRFIQLRSEESAAYAASAFSKLTGGIGVVVSHAGPGAGHLVNGLADAMKDKVPVFAITGQVESFYIGTSHKQYINQQKLLGAVTIRSELLASPSSLQTVTVGLLRTSVSQAGPVHLSIPKDFWQQEIDPVTANTEPYLYEAPRSSDDVISEAAAWISGLQKPLILAGRGASGAVAQLLALAELLGAGVVRSLPLAGVLPEHSLVVGGIGEGGAEASIELLQQCDGLIKVGATYWPSDLTSDDKQVLSIDAHPANIGRGIPADFGVVGDARLVLSALHDKLIGTKQRRAWRKTVEKYAADWRKRLEGELQRSSDLYPGRAMRILSDFADANAVICLDVGDHVLWFNRFFQGKGQRILVSGRWRGMGFSLGASIAAKLTERDTQVICVVGDGGFSMLMGEFVSAVELGLPIIYVLMNNRSYAMEANAMASAGLDPIGVSLQDIRYDLVAQACGGVGCRITPGELGETLEEIRGMDKPVLIDLLVDPTALPTAKL